MAERREPGPQVTHARDLFLEAVKGVGLPAGVDPAEAARGAMCTLTRRIEASDAVAFLDQLPVAIREIVQCGRHREHEEAEPWSRAELLGQLAEHVGARPPEAERIARAVFAALQRHVPPEATAAFGEALPSDLAELWRFPETGLDTSGAPAGSAP